MLGRLFSFVFFSLLGGLLSLLLGAHILGWTLGLLAGMMVWFVLDFWRGWRVMHWLTQPQQSVPTQWGIWGEVADRVRRLQRLQDRQLALSQSSLDQFLSAIPVSYTHLTLPTKA